LNIAPPGDGPDRSFAAGFGLAQAGRLAALPGERQATANLTRFAVLRISKNLRAAR
jgi:hypothetical protein